MRHPSVPLRALALPVLLGAALHAAKLDDYLARNHQKLEPGDGFSASLLDPAGKRVFLLGESHAVAGMEALDLAMLRYLHGAAGVRLYLAEIGFAAGEMTNRYLDTADDKLLDFLTDELRGSPAWSRENHDFLKRLGEWNRGLPPADRIRFVGVDIDHQRPIAWRYLSELAGDPGVAPEAIRDVLARLGKPGGNDQLDRDLAASLAAHRPQYAALLGDRLEDFELVTANLQKRDEFYQSKYTAMRDRVMYDTFRKLQARRPGARWYGRFGNVHTSLRRMEDFDSFATMLQQDPEWTGKVLSIRSLYRNCARLDPDGYRSAPLSDDPSQTAPFAAAAGGSPMTLFRLDPAMSLPWLGNGAATDYAQYVLLVQDAPAAHPLREVLAVSVAAAPPVVVRTVPEAGAIDVEPGIREIRVTFSKETRDKSWAFVTDSNFISPAGDPQPRYEAGNRTVVVPVQLRPGATYGVWLNQGPFLGFVDQQGQPAVPYLLVFQTRAK